MLRGLYSGATALHALERQQALIASNLANLQSGGHRRAVLAMEERLNDRGQSKPGTRVASEGLDFSAGTIQPGGALDFAINGDGFFQVSDGQNNYFTRNGSFHRTAEGALVNDDGMAVLGTGGPITIDPTIAVSSLQIGEDGSINAGGQTLGQLALTSFANNRDLIPNGQVYFQAADGQTTVPSEGRVMQGKLELSNARPVTELVSLIITSRMFEAAQKSIRTISETVQQYYRE